MSEMVRRGCLEFSALTVKEAATILELYAATQENTVYNYILHVKIQVELHQNNTLLKSFRYESTC